MASPGHPQPAGAGSTWMACVPAAPWYFRLDLANLVNEAAINAVRDGRDVLFAADFAAARHGLLIGPAMAPAALAARGQALGGRDESGEHRPSSPCAVRDADPGGEGHHPPARRGARRDRAAAGGGQTTRTASLPSTRSRVRLGGRAAEIVVGQPSTGASDDLLVPPISATRMVREWAFRPRWGPSATAWKGRAWGDNPFAGGPTPRRRAAIHRPGRAWRFRGEAESRATTLLRTNLDMLRRGGRSPAGTGTIDGSDLVAIVGVPDAAWNRELSGPEGRGDGPGRGGAGRHQCGQREGPPGQLTSALQAGTRPGRDGRVARGAAALPAPGYPGSVRSLGCPGRCPGSGAPARTHWAVRGRPGRCSAPVAVPGPGTTGPPGCRNPEGVGRVGVPVPVGVGAVRVQRGSPWW